MENSMSTCCIRQCKIHIIRNAGNFRVTILRVLVKDRSELLALEESQHNNKLDNQPKYHDMAIIIQD